MMPRPLNRESSHKIRKPEKSRLDVLLVDRGLAPSRERARAMLLAGQVLVDGTKQEKAGSQVRTDASIEIFGETFPYASRGGRKLEGALADFGVDPRDRICLDIGSSTGGFTDCLLRRGAQKVYDVDVSIEQLDWKLRQDPRVVTVERNARYLRPEDIGEAPSLVVMDVSFISAAKILPAIVAIAPPGTDFLILVKPQFELERREVGKGGIVREESLQRKAVGRVCDAAAGAGLEILGVEPSHLTGAEGNQEYFLYARQRR